MKPLFFSKLVVIISLAVASLSYGQSLRQQNGRWVGETKQTFAVQKTGKLTIRNVQGDVEMSTWTKTQIDVRVICHMDIFSKEEAQEAMEQIPSCFRQNGDALVLDASQFQRSWMSLDLVVILPENFEADVSLEAGDMEITGLKGALSCRTGAGDVDGSQLGGKVNIVTGGGDVDLTDVAGDVSVQTGGGDVEAGKVAGTMRVQTGGGDVDLSDIKKKTSVQTGGGEVGVSHCYDAVEIQTGGGEVSVAFCESDVHVTTGGGEVECETVNGKLEVRTGGGSVTAEFVKGPVDVVTGGGNIELNDVHSSVAAVSGGGDVEVSYALAQIDPNHSVDIQTSSGDIVLAIPGDFKATVTIQVSSGKHNWSDHKITSDFPLTLKTETDWQGNEVLHAKGDLNGGGSPVVLKTSQGDVEIMKRESR